MRAPCPECGSDAVQPVGENRYRCVQCGAWLGAQLLPAAGAIRCPVCQAVAFGDAPYCYQCGAELRPVQSFVTLRSCPACEQFVPARAVYCPYCRAEMTAAGMTVAIDSAGPQRESVGCPACGRTIGAAARVCRYCGVNVDEFIANLRQEGLERLERAEQADAAERQRRHRQGELDSRKPGLALGLALVVVLVVLGALSWAATWLSSEADGMQNGLVAAGVVGILIVAALAGALVWSGRNK